MSKSKSITGRDGYIMAKALYWAIKYSQQQPDGLREWSDEQDMKALLNAHYRFFAEGFVETGKRALECLDEDRAYLPDHTEDDWKEVIAYLTPPNLIDEKRNPPNDEGDAADKAEAA
jgi:hypothetical protein